MAKRKLDGLTPNQKLALIGGAAVLALVLAFALFYTGSQDQTTQDFTDFLYLSNKSGIIMDVRNSPDVSQNSVVMQCGVNLISSGGFFAKTQKDLLVYACDNTGCISSQVLENLGNQSDIDESELVVPFDEVLYNMRGRAYFHIKYGKNESKIFHSTYVEVFVNENSDPSECKLGIRTE